LSVEISENSSAFFYKFLIQALSQQNASDVFITDVE